MRLTIFGSGYVGLVTGACFADVGHNVLCVDTDPMKIGMLNKGHSPIFEPGLTRKLQENKESGRISFSMDAEEGIAHSDVIFIAVGTPQDEDGSADLTYVLDVARTIGQYMEEPKLIITKSTVPVGSADKVRETIAETLKERGKDLEFDVASNPEFLKEGNAVSDFEKPDRIIIGVTNDKSAAILKDIYAPFNRRFNRIIQMDVRSAELTKYAANAMLATKISFMNEMANLAENLGADIEQVRVGIGSDSRIGYDFIYPGTGYGGSCFPKDIKALVHTAKNNSTVPTIISAVDEVNENQKALLFYKAMRHFKGDIDGKTFALWGLSFKPDTDDMREAPSRIIMEMLWSKGCTVRVYDPKAMDECRRIYGEPKNLIYCDKAMDALDGADGLMVVTEWKEFRAIDARDLKERMKTPLVFDGRNIYNPDRMKDLGIAYHSIGRRAVLS